jgi:hypothetical protein
VQYTCGVDILKPSQDLVHEELDMIIRKGLIRLDDLGKIGLHKLAHYIDFFEVLSRARLEDSLNSNDVVML